MKIMLIHSSTFGQMGMGINGPRLASPALPIYVFLIISA